MLLNSWTELESLRLVRTRPLGRILFWPSTLMAGSSAALWPTETQSTSIKRSKPPLLTQALFKSLEALLMYFISIQSTLISIVFISKGAVFVGPLCRHVFTTFLIIHFHRYSWLQHTDKPEVIICNLIYHQFDETRKPKFCSKHEWINFQGLQKVCWKGLYFTKSI